MRIPHIKIGKEQKEPVLVLLETLAAYRNLESECDRLQGKWLEIFNCADEYLFSIDSVKQWQVNVSTWLSKLSDKRTIDEFTKERSQREIELLNIHKDTSRKLFDRFLNISFDDYTRFLASSKNEIGKQVLERTINDLSDMQLLATFLRLQANYLTDRWSHFESNAISYGGCPDCRKESEKKLKESYLHLNQSFKKRMELPLLSDAYFAAGKDVRGVTPSVFEIRFLEHWMQNYGAAPELKMDQYLDSRRKLVEMSQYWITESPLQTMRLRKILEDLYSVYKKAEGNPEMQKLHDLDAKYTTQLEVLYDARQYFCHVNEQGKYEMEEIGVQHLLDADISGKTNLLEFMEKVSPGITNMIRGLKSKE